MRQTQAIYLKFNASSVSDSVQINVPFQVKTIHIKSMSYQAENLGKTNYIMVMSPFGLNAPWGILNQDTTYSSGAIQDIVIQVKNPITIQGYYNFRMVNMNGLPAATSGGLADGVDYIGAIVEFNAVDETLE